MSSRMRMAKGRLKEKEKDEIGKKERKKERGAGEWRSDINISWLNWTEGAREGRPLKHDFKKKRKK